MSDLIWEFYQHGKVTGASTDAKQALSKVYESKGEIASIDRKLERLLLLNQAIWSLVKLQTVLTEFDLMNEIKRLDLLDGQLDGKVSTTKNCIHCNTTLTVSALSCYSCGGQNPVTSAFHGL